MKKFCVLIILLIGYQMVFAQTFNVERIEPPNWWAGMKRPQLQLLIHGANIAGFNVKIDYPGVTYDGTIKTENPNYLFINLTLSPELKPGTMNMVFTTGKKSASIPFEFKAREGFNGRIMGLNPGDLIYLIMPDRFANGDTSNDIIAGMRQTTIDRTQPYQRHGGDLQGIIDHLDYLQNLGVTALWLNPVLENDQPETSYHGYAATDCYKVDPRFGGNKAYKSLIDDLHHRGMKIIMDIVPNHVGSENWFIKDLPTQDWIHQHQGFLKSNFRIPAQFDPHGSQIDKKTMEEGWFDTHMPDLNQNNELVANYIIQNNIWWIEEFGTDAFRIDTYPYNYLPFLEKWADAIYAEYPNYSIFGETWVEDKSVEAYYEGDAYIVKNFNSKVSAMTDFVMYNAINEALNGKFDWRSGIMKIYYTLAEDYLYANPYDQVIFLDNHDTYRFFSTVGEDMNKYKMGIGLVMTLRGIPQFYYGTELAFKNNDWINDGKYRVDFPGGWPDDKGNKFLPDGRTDQEIEAFNYFSKLANWRKNEEVIKTGKLMQFIPEDNTYVYFRYTDQQCVMVLLNRNEDSKTLDTQRFRERIEGYHSANNVVTDAAINDLSQLELPPMSITILELEH